MSRHSKNNTAGSVFTYHEKQMMGYGSKKARIGADSVKPFDCCCICLSVLVDPLSCSKGHLYCRECILKHLIAQKKTQKREMRKYMEQEQEKAAAAALKKEQGALQEYEKFEKTNNALLPNSKSMSRSPAKIVPKGFLSVVGDDGEIVQASLEARREVAKTGLQLKDLHANSEAFTDEKSVNNFWVPQLAPEAAPEDVKKPSMHTMCPEGDHPVNRKHLIAVKFEIAVDDDGKQSTGGKYLCATCKKGLTNAVKSVLAAECGHVVCSYCAKNFLKIEGKCGVCSKRVRDRDLIDLQVGGTGFAAHHKVEAKAAAPSARV